MEWLHVTSHRFSFASCERLLAFSVVLICVCVGVNTG